MSPFFSQVPMGWMSAESTRRQKSLVLSLPSRRRRRRTPVMPITVAMQTEVEFRGSRASSFMPTLKSLEGGSLDCRQEEDSLMIRVFDCRWKVLGLILNVLSLPVGIPKQDAL